MIGAARRKQCGVVAQTEALDQCLEVTRVRALQERYRFELLVQVFWASALLDVVDLESETAETEHPLQERPGIAAVANHIARDRTGEEDALRHDRISARRPMAGRQHKSVDRYWVDTCP